MGAVMHSSLPKTQGDRTSLEFYLSVCIFGYIKRNIVTCRIHSDAQLVSLCLTGTLSSNKSDSHMLAYFISSNFLLS